MLVGEAKAIARQWVLTEAGALPGFAGAFYHGSLNWLPADAVLPATSDVDIMVVLAEANPPVKPGKFLYHNVLLEVSYVAAAQLQPPEQVLGNYHLAGSFHSASIIADPSGQLMPLQAVVAQQYAKRRWVEKRCEHARDNILRNLASLRADDPLHDQVSAWLFATGVTTHVLLVAGLKNPTVRQRYLAVQRLLAEYGHPAFYETLLTLLGCADMSQARAEQHLAALTAVFDVAKTVVKTPFFFATDISERARPIAIDGSQTLIARGLHREAIFWLVATYARCQKILYQDASGEWQEKFTPDFRALLADLGITSFGDMQQRGAEVKAFLPRLWQVKDAIMAANLDVEA